MLLQFWLKSCIRRNPHQTCLFPKFAVSRLEIVLMEQLRTFLCSLWVLCPHLDNFFQYFEHDLFPEDELKRRKFDDEIIDADSLCSLAQDKVAVEKTGVA